MFINYCIYYLLTYLVDLSIEVYFTGTNPTLLKKDEYLGSQRLEMFKVLLELSHDIFGPVRTIDTHRGTDLYFMKRNVYGFYEKRDG